MADYVVTSEVTQKRPRAGLTSARLGLVARRTSAQFFLWLVASVSLFPVLWIILTSFKYKRDIWRLPPRILPTMGLTLESYRVLLARMDLLGHFTSYFLNSVIVALATVLLVCFFGCLSGYAFARLKFPFRNWLFALLLLPLFVPSTLLLNPLYVIMKGLGLFDTKLGLILAYAAGGVYMQGAGGVAGGVFGGVIWATFFTRGVYLSVSRELEDAARIDGCSFFRMFIRVMLPMGRNGLILVAVTNFVGAWNEYIMVWFLTVNVKARTLGAGILWLQGSWQYIEPGVVAAMVVLALLPTAIVFLVLHRHFTKGLTEGIFRF